MIATKVLKGIVFIEASLLVVFCLRFRRLNLQLRDAQVPVEFRELVEIHWSNDVHNREFPVVSVEHRETANLLAIQQQVDFEISFLTADDVHETRPSGRPELCAD